MRAFFRQRLVWGLAMLALALTAPLARPAAGEATMLDPAAAVKLSQSVIGTSVGDYAFYDRAGRRVLLSSYRGKPLLVSFVYSGCFQVCPVTTKMPLCGGEARALRRRSFNVITMASTRRSTRRRRWRISPGARATSPNWEFRFDAAGLILTRDGGFTYRATQAVSITSRR